MTKTHVCFIQSYAYPLFSGSATVHGGSEIQLFFLAKELAADRAFTVSFVVGDFGQPPREQKLGVSIYRSLTPKNGDSPLTKVGQAFKYLLLFRKINADVYVTSSANSTVGLVTFFCKLFRKKHIHRTANQKEVTGEFVSDNGWLGKIYRYGLTRADGVITQNVTHQRLLADNFSIRALVLKNGFYLSDAATPAGKNHVLWVGRCIREKNPDRFLRLVKTFPQYQFVMITPLVDTEKKLWENIKKEAQSLPNLKFINQVPFSEIQKYFDAATVFVNTSDSEGYPNTFIQAGLGHTPIVSWKVDPDNFIVKYNCGYACAGEEIALTERLGKLLTDRADWGQKSANMYKYVCANHDIKKISGMFKNAILSLVDKI
ncbi:MAG: glycosyltransferase [Patescibacteria group bacterium]